ncbi:hypothetical protein ABU614_19655 [Lysobacter firmicutimachus]|uniref:Uncharacterized protein n=1 Tax=Lysobacter firmicutimachus TaxID=1792846 RepID=A0AAU8MQN4_9GAMM
MRSARLDLELCALEAAIPFLRASLDDSCFESEIRAYRQGLNVLAADAADRSELDRRWVRALGPAAGDPPY